MFSNRYNYAVDVSPLVPKLSPGTVFWLGCEYQHSIDRWLVGCGREGNFMLLAPAVFQRLIKEAVRLKLVVAAYHPHPISRRKAAA